MQDHHEVIVIGGSFAGLSAAMQLARARRRVLVIDAGRPRNRFAAHAHGFFGQDGKPPAHIVEEQRDRRDATTTARAKVAEALRRLAPESGTTGVSGGSG